MKSHNTLSRFVFFSLSKINFLFCKHKSSTAKMPSRSYVTVEIKDAEDCFFVPKSEIAKPHTMKKIKAAVLLQQQFTRLEKGKLLLSSISLIAHKGGRTVLQYMDQDDTLQIESFSDVDLNNVSL